MTENYISLTQLPHDSADAARLYGEVLDKARIQARGEMINAAIEQLGADNCLRVIKTRKERDVNNFKDKYRAIFEINGKTFDISADEISTVDRLTREAFTVFIARQISKALFSDEI